MNLSNSLSIAYERELHFTIFINFVSGLLFMQNDTSNSWHRWLKKDDRT